MEVKCYPMEIRELCRSYKSGQIVLDPPYQRRPAWKTKQRMDLLGSIFNGIPIPAVILYRTVGPKGRLRLEVMDGKQRLETIFHFRYGGVVREEQELGFWLRIDDRKNREWLSYDDLRKRKNRQEFGLSIGKFLDYELPVVEYRGKLVGLAGQRIAEKEIFARINSTGSKLTTNEIRHAQSTPFFDMGSELEAKWQKRMVEKWRVFSKADVARYQFHEFILELCTVVQNKGISDRRTVLERFMRTDWQLSDLRKCKRDTDRVLVWLSSILREHEFVGTRFSKKSDFYTLFSSLAGLAQRGAVTVDRKLNRRAREVLVAFSKRADKVDSTIVKYLPSRISPEDRAIAKYIVTTREATDQLRSRKAREDVLRPLLEGVFKRRKADRRTFRKEQKRLLWLEAKPYAGKIWCPNPRDNRYCAGRVSFEESEVDHRFAYVKGGSTDHPNGQLLCKSCNRSKGAS